MSNSTNRKKFKGEIELYLANQRKNFDSQINTVLMTLKFKTWLCRANIRKLEGFCASHVLFVLIISPMLKIKTVHHFCQRHWQVWSDARKDVFYRFKRNAKYRWRSFFYKINIEIFNRIDLEKTPVKHRFLIIDDSNLAKTGRKIENVSFVFDHNLNRNILGFCIVTIGLLIPSGFYPLDFSYRFGKKRHPKSPVEKIGDPRSSSGQRSCEAKRRNKLELALEMIERAVNSGVTFGYVLFDSWYAWPSFINAVRKINDSMHVICRLKNGNVKYEYNGSKYTLSELYQKVKKKFRKDSKTGLRLCRVKVGLGDLKEEATIVFSKNYQEPENDGIKGRKMKKREKWVAFLSTDTSLHSSTIIRHYIKRWPIEVCFKECKQMLGLGKEQGNSFNAQVCATTVSFLRYNILNYLNWSEKYSTLGELFEHIADESAMVTYSHRLWLFFYGLLRVSISKIFELFDIEDNFQPYIDTFAECLTGFGPFKGCET